MARLFILCLTMALTIQPAQAHPHVFITADATLNVEDGLLTSIREVWRFDLFFSQVLISDFDRDQSGTLEGIEVIEMEDTVFGNLADYNYFTWLTIDGEDQDFSGVRDVTVTEEDGELVFAFTVLLQDPADIAAREAVLSLYDPTIYIDIFIPEDAIAVTGMAGTTCGFGFSEGEEMHAADGFLTPQVVKLDCSA